MKMSVEACCEVEDVKSCEKADASPGCSSIQVWEHQRLDIRPNNSYNGRKIGVERSISRLHPGFPSQKKSIVRVLTKWRVIQVSDYLVGLNHPGASGGVIRGWSTAWIMQDQDNPGIFRRLDVCLLRCCIHFLHWGYI
jgi:hypothetical protein